MTDAAVGPRIGEVLPRHAWDILCEDAAARLVDVRSRAEWTFVGTPTLPKGTADPHFVEWASFPGMIQNGAFADQVLAALDGHVPSRLLFLCRSGARSLSAARTMDEVFAGLGHDVECINVAEGFEGDPDSQKRRGAKNGWKATGLAWQQS
jgi:rhodanese-related sulfurtransferase